MNTSHNITMLGTGLIGMFYTLTLHRYRSRDTVKTVFSRSEERVKKFASDWNIPKWTTNMEEAINDPDTDVVIIGIPNHLHKEAVLTAAKAKKAILCTKPLGRNAAEAKEMLEAVEKAGVFQAYLEDLVYTPKTLKSLESVKNGALGKVLWVRSRETHPGPHSAWFWDMDKAGGGAIIDMGCHCAEIVRNFIGKDVKPVEVMCWADTLVHNIDAEDHGIALIRFENGSMGQIEVSWAFRGGMDLRDEVAGTEGTIWMDHFLRTGFQMFTNVGQGGYVAEKAEGDTGWLYPVGDEVNELGYTHMFIDVFDAMDKGRIPMETFYDGYVVNAVIDACYKSSKSRVWEPVKLDIWRGGEHADKDKTGKELIDGKYTLVKKEKMPDGRTKQILKDVKSGEIIEKIK
ncbi:Gfo/Idh/MocA family oxidoreductase [candidate division KSB1 bacterium]|nr:Gfo/Idh/MocA family oxidoreductase [candidate division KSB1 bacterium]